MATPTTLEDFLIRQKEQTKKGGKARWKDKTREERSMFMRWVRAQAKVKPKELVDENDIIRREKRNNYNYSHTWLRRNYGPAFHCELSSCSKQSTRFQWALIHGKQHDQNRDNYMQLCVKCHAKYDKAK